MINEIIIVILFLLCGIALLINQYFLYRLDKVGQFRKELIDMASATTKKAIWSGIDDYEKVYELYDKYSLYDMLYSFKPLTLEAWYTEEEIKILKGE